MDNGRGLLTLQDGGLSVITTIGESGLHELTTRLGKFYRHHDFKTNHAPVSGHCFDNYPIPNPAITEGGVVAARLNLQVRMKHAHEMSLLTILEGCIMNNAELNSELIATMAGKLLFITLTS